MKKDYFLGLSEEGFHKVAYLEWGKAAESTPIICVHGLTRHSGDFDELAIFLSSHGNHVFCPDIVGRGDSDWLKNPLHYTYEQYIADMNVMIGRTHAKQVDWIGTSMGGLIGIMLAAMPNSPIRRLVINDIGPQIPAKAIARLSQYAGKDPEFSSLEEAKRYFKSFYAEFGTLSETEWEHLAAKNVREVAPGKYITKLDPRVKLSPAKSVIAWRLLLNPHKALEGTFFDVDLWHVWRKITCPVLVIHGENSDILLSATIEKMRTTHTNTQVIHIPGAGHAPMLLDVELHKMIYQWLQKN